MLGLQSRERSPDHKLPTLDWTLDRTLVALGLNDAFRTFLPRHLARDSMIPFWLPLARSSLRHHAPGRLPLTCQSCLFSQAHHKLLSCRLGYPVMCNRMLSCRQNRYLHPFLINRTPSPIPFSFPSLQYHHTFSLVLPALSLLQIHIFFHLI